MELSIWLYFEWLLWPIEDTHNYSE